MFVLSGKRKYGLALHTTSGELGIVIGDFTNDRRSQTWELGVELSTHLHDILSKFIYPQTWEDLAFMAVAIGPGSFTSTRIGVVTARTIAQQLDIPLFTVSSLAAYSSFVSSHLSFEKEGGLSKQVAVQLPAHRGEIFVAIYKVAGNDAGVVELLPDAVMKPEKWEETLANWPDIYELIEAPKNLGGSVTNVLELAYLDWQKGLRPHWSEALPFYGQHPIE